MLFLFRPRSAVTALLLAALLTPLHHDAHAAGGTLLRYHWTVGQHFSEVNVEPSTSIIKASVSAMNSTTKEVDRYTTTDTITKIFSDGSGLVHRTFSNVSITTNGKTVHYPLKGYAVDQKVSSTGVVLSTKKTGSASSDLPAGITDPTPTEYPQAPVAIGGTWTQVQSVSGLGKVTLHFTLQAIGSAQGRQTITVLGTMRQPLHFSSNGIDFNVQGTESGIAMLVAATGELVAPSHLTNSFIGTIGGTVNAVKIKGTWSLTGSQDSAPTDK